MLLKALYYLRDIIQRYVRTNKVLQKQLQELKLKEAALKEREQRFQYAVEASENTFFDIDLTTGKYDLFPASDKGTRSILTTHVDVLVEAMVCPNDRLARAQALKEYLSGHNEIYKAEYRISDGLGGWRWVLSRGRAIRDKQGNPIRLIGAITDITHIKEREEALRQSNEQFQLAMDASENAIFVGDLSTLTIKVTKSWVERFGFKQPLPLDEFHRIIHPDDLPGVLERLELLRSGAVDQTEGIIRVYTPKGEWVWLKQRNKVVRNDEGKPVRIVGAVMDVTSLKEANIELEHLVNERTKELKASLEALEAFTYTVSHDIKAPLRSIDGYGQFLEEDCISKLNEDEIIMLRNMRRIARDMIVLVDKLLEYATTSKMKITYENVDMGSVFASVYYELKIHNPSRSVHLEVEGKLPIVRGDNILLRQVVANILSNAFKFTRDQKQALIKVKCNLIAGEYVFSVNDNGAGFDMQYVKKLFGIFQRLHTIKEFEGSGIGLATARSIIEKHGGRTWIEGKQNEGATVYFTLPAKKAN